MRVALALGLTVAAAFLTMDALAQGGATFPPGPIYLTEGIEVKAGETLVIGPGTSLTGSGNITVWGTLLVNGTVGSPAEFSVQVRVLEGGRVDMRQARLWGVNATALEIFGGEVTLSDVLMEANTRAAIVKGEGRLSAQDVVLRDHTGEALYVEGSARVEFSRATFNGNGRGVTLYSARSFHANDSVFAANGQHIVVDLGPWTRPDADILLARNHFRPPSPTPAQLASIVLRHDTPLVDEGDERLVRLDSNRIEGAPVGLRVEGRSLVVESTNDTFAQNAIGLSVQQSTVRLARPTLDNDRDIDGSGRVTIEDATYLRDRAPPPFVPGVPRAPWVPWAIGAGLVAALAGAALAVPMLARRARQRAAAPPSPEPLPAEVEARRPDLATPISPVEMRILDDILEHPGTLQRDIAERLGYTRQALHYHVKKLEARGLVAKRVEGRATRCEVPAPVAALLARETRTGSQEKA